LLSSDLVGADGDKQDRFRQRFVVGRTAIRHRLRIERRRAGEAGGIRALAVEYEPMTDGWYRGLAEAT
ncbi:MAG: hypothetical protein L0206_09115, partial [Actinobacteria bacterium]|nr:hypothetical protein [Actinomycetota bacterium]